MKKSRTATREDVEKTKYQHTAVDDHRRERNGGDLPSSNGKVVGAVLQRGTNWSSGESGIQVEALLRANDKECSYYTTSERRDHTSEGQCKKPRLEEKKTEVVRPRRNGSVCYHEGKGWSNVG